MTNSWDNNATYRHSQLVDGKDVSFDAVLAPCLLSILQDMEGHQLFRALDVGCGTGVLAAILSQTVREIVGIDPSAESIKIARQYVPESERIEFHHVGIEDFATVAFGEFDFVVANMVFQAIGSLPTALRQIADALRDGGKFVFSIPHPWFWTLHRAQDYPENFDYWEAREYNIPFIITLDPTPLPSKVPYFHRPLETYYSEVHLAGLQVIRVHEPAPNTLVSKAYRESWPYPRFLVFECSKQR